MQANLVSRELQDAIKAIHRIFDKAPIVTKGSNQDCLIASKKEGILLESANLGLYTRIRVNAEVEEPGKVVINRDLLSNIKLMGDQATCKIKNDKYLEFRSGKSSFKLAVGQEVDEIESQRPANVPDVSVSLPCDILRAGIKRVSFSSTSTKETPDLNLQVKIHKNHLIMMANDSYRGSLFKTKLDEDVPDAHVTITAPFFASVIAAIPPSEVVGIGIDDKLIRIVGGNIDVCHPVLQNFDPPNIEAHIEKLWATEYNVGCTLNISEAKDAIGAATSVALSAGADVRVLVKFADSGKASAKVESSVGTSDCKFEVQGVSSNKADSIFVSAKYILESLGLLGEGDILMKAWDRQVIFKSEVHGVSLLFPQIKQGDE